MAVEIKELIVKGFVNGEKNIQENSENPRCPGMRGAAGTLPPILGYGCYIV